MAKVYKVFKATSKVGQMYLEIKKQQVRFKLDIWRLEIPQRMPVISRNSRLK